MAAPAFWHHAGPRVAEIPIVFNIDQTQNAASHSLISNQGGVTQMPRDISNTWQDFARAASVEQDSEKLASLILQLNHALDEEDRTKRSGRLAFAVAD